MAATGYNIQTTADTIAFRDQTTGEASISYDHSTEILSISGTNSVNFDVDVDMAAGLDVTGNITMTGATVATQSWVSSQNYLTSETDDQTLDEVLTQGNTSSQEITVGGATINGDIDVTGDATITGVLGIGATPDSGINLHIKTSGPKFLVEDTQIGGEWARFSAGTTGSAMKFSNTGNFSIGPVASKTDTSVINTFFISSSGEIGLGTTTPKNKLDISLTNGQWRVNDYGSMYFANTSDTGYERYIHSRSDGALSIGRVAIANLTGGTGGYAATTYDHIHINSSGEVGIGTTTPDSKLSVTSSTINSEDILYLKSGADSVNDYLGIAWEIGAGGNGPHSAIRSFAGPSASDARLGFLTTSDGGTTLTEGLSVAHNGNVGIGTTSPNAKLNVLTSGSGVSSLRLDSDSTNDLSFNHYTGYSTLRDNTLSSNRMLFFDSGKINLPYNLGVGLSGATQPSYTLDVAGNSARIGNNLQTTTSLYLTATNTAGAPARAVETIMAGYEGRGIGTFYTDVTYSGEEWFCGMNYSGNFDRWSIGYDQSGGQPEYLANALFTVNSSGNVGIGTTSPSAKLHVQSPDETVLRIERTSGSGYAALDIKDGVGTTGNSAIRFSDTAGSAGQIEYEHADNSMRFSTNTAGSERMRLLSSGQLIVGGTAFGYAGTDLQVGNTSDSQNGLNILTSTTGYGYVLFGDGLANADSYVGQISYKHGDDYMAFRTAGTEKIRITSSGEVGIGTTSPASLLHISSSSSGDAVVIIESDTDNNNEYDNPQLQFKQDGGATIAKAGLEGVAGTIFTNSLANTAYFGNDEAAPLQLYTNATARLTIESGGNVGIGTTNPAKQLHVRGSAPFIRIEEDSASNKRLDLWVDPSTAIGYIGANQSAQQLSFQTANTDRIRILNNGNVGIGTTSPQQKLHVEGSIYLGPNNSNNFIHSGANLGIQADGEVKIVSDVNDTSGVGGVDIIFGYGSSTDTDSNQDFTESELGTYPRVEVMRIDTSANRIGILDSTPSYTLDVNGTLRATGAATFDSSVTVAGDLTVNGTTTTINSTTISVDDKNIELGSVSSPDTSTADGGGITLLAGSSESDHKTIKWINSTDAWTFSERISIPTGSAASPSLTFAGDEDTGIYRSSDNTINFSTSGTNRAFVGTTGLVSTSNVYIGTTGEFRNIGGVWKATTGATGNGFQFINSIDGTALTISSTGDVVASGSVTATSLIKSGGSSSEFLKADGSVDSNTYLTTGSASSTYLPLAGGTMTGNINLNDDIKVRFGDAQDLELYHSSAGNGHIVNKTGVLDIRNEVHGGDIKLQAENASGTLQEYFRVDGGAELNIFYKDSFYGDGRKALFGDNSDLQIYHDGSDSYIKDAGTGDLRIVASSTKIYDADSSHFQAVFTDGGSVDLYHGGNKKFETTSSGITVTGSIVKSGGSSSEFLKADGSVDSNTYLTTSSASSTYLPLAGGTIDGSLIIDTDTGSQPFYVTRSGGSDQSLKVYISDENAIFESIQDETADNHGGFIFNMDAGTTHPFFDIRKNNSTIMRIDGSGNVGIGPLVNSTPLYPLDIIKPSNTNSDTIINLRANWANTSADKKIGSVLFTAYDADVNSGSYYETAKIGARAANEWTSSSNVNADIFFETINAGNLASRMVIKHDGDVGIGTTSPDSRLELAVASTADMVINANDRFKIRGNGTAIWGNSASNGELTWDSGYAIIRGQSGNGLKLAVNNSTNTGVTINTSGEVGIGNTSPASKLHIGTYPSSINSSTLPTTPSNYLITLTPPSTTNYYGGGIGWSEGTNVAASINTYDAGSGGALGLVFSTGNNTTLSEALRIDSAGRVGIGVTPSSAELEVNGHFAATTKSFIIDNPKTGGKLQYGVVESDQHSVFVRGKNDTNLIELPEEWEWLVDPDSVTVQLTSIGQMQQLFVISQDNKKIKIGGLATSGQYNYTVYGERVDVDKLQKHLK